jgi:hypothetical protein
MTAVLLLCAPSETQWEKDKEALLNVIRKSHPVGLNGSRLKSFNLRSDFYIGGVDRSGATLNQDSGRLGNLLALSEPPSALDSPYVKITKETDIFYGKASYESLLAGKIARSKGGLRPADILAMSLEVCENDYLLATLTAHNLLKEAAYSSRTAGFTNTVGQSGTTQRVIVVDPRDIIDKLENLRPSGDRFEGDVIGPYYHAFGLLFVGGALSSNEASVGATMESALRHLKNTYETVTKKPWNSPPDPTKEAINTWAAASSGDINKVMAESTVSVTISGENRTELGRDVTLYGEAIFSIPQPHKYVWRDENYKIIGVNVRELIFTPKKPGLNRVILDICESGNGPTTFGPDSSYRFACPGVRASASHLVYADVLGKVSVSIEGPSQAMVGESVELKAVVTNLDPVNQMPDLYYYWRVNDEQVFLSKDNILKRIIKDKKPLTIMSYIGQMYMNKIQRIAGSSPHRISVTDFPASLIIEGPSRMRVNSSAQFRAVVKFTEAPTQTPEVQYVWTDENSGMRLGNSHELTLNKFLAGSYTIKVDAYVLDKGRRVKLAEASRVLIVEDIEKEGKKETKQADDRKEPPETKSLPVDKTEQTEDELVAEYRSLLPAVLTIDKKPWQTKFEIVSNAVKIKPDEYKVNYKFYCIIEQGPDKGKDYPCSEYDAVLNSGQIKAAVLEMRIKVKK